MAKGCLAFHSNPHLHRFTRFFGSQRHIVSGVQALACILGTLSKLTCGIHALDQL
jgi:hypothetical protein